MTMNINRRGVLLGATALAAGGLISAAAPSWSQQDESGRTNHALLVAVTSYPELPRSADLIGPNNDAMLVREFLTSAAPVAFAPENVAVLADGLQNAVSPTREAIRAALDDLTAKVSNGDFVYLQFSGHGVQQPAMDPSLEPDGLDEVFLPRDTGMWTDRTKGVPNAIIDKEFRDHLQAIRDKGAFIWAVFDCCHSGTMTRAAGLGGEDEVERKIDYQLLGITDEAMAEAVAQSDNATRSLSGPAPRQNALGLTTAEPTGAASLAPGGMVAFFAAQTTETTPEMMLPRGSEEAQRLGLFTFTLLEKIAENPAVSYRQLGQAILQAYSAANRTRPTPLFEGDLDKPVFGMTSGDRIAQWAIKVEGNTLEIPAGQLHRLSPGAKLAILATPGSRIEDAVGFVEVTSAKNLTSRISAIPYEGKPSLSVADIPPGAYARLTEVAIGLELVVARPGEGDTGEFSNEIALINAALDKIVEEGSVPVNLRFVDAREDADIKLAVLSEMDVGIIIANQGQQSVAARASLSVEPRVWLLPPSAELSLDDGRRAPSLPLAGASAEDIAGMLADNLVSIFRATSLSRLAAASDFHSEEVSVGFKILDSTSNEVRPMQLGQTPVVHPDDQVHIEARNGSSRPVDINILYIGSDYSIGHMYAERLHSGSEIDLPLLAFTDESYGMERMVVVLSEAAPMTPVEDLSFLEQIGVRQVTRAAGVNPAGFGDLLRDVAGAPATRGGMRIGEKAGAKGAVMIFPMETTPRG